MSPQVRQGLAPVAGEIARTVRLAGLRAAAPWLLSGATWSAAQARQAGLLHALAEDEHQFALLGDAACGKISAVQPWDARAAPLPGGGVDTPAVRAWLRAAPARLRLEADGPAPAAEAILAAMVEGSQVDFGNALLIESRYFCQTAITSVVRKHRFSL